MKVYFEFAACASMKLRIKNIKGRKPSPSTKLNFFLDRESLTCKTTTLRIQSID